MIGRAMISLLAFIISLIALTVSLGLVFLTGDAHMHMLHMHIHTNDTWVIIVKLVGVALSIGWLYMTFITLRCALGEVCELCLWWWDTRHCRSHR